MKKITRALISVFHKEGLEPILNKLHQLDVEIISTGGTYEFIHSLDIPAIAVETLTQYPSILGGRVKTLHPGIFGGILARRDHENDLKQLGHYNIAAIDLVIVDLYPFEETVKQGKDHQEIIEKIDIGGISLIRAAAKNYQDVLIISHRRQYDRLLSLLESKNGSTDLNDREHFALEAFQVSSAYDAAIFNYFNRHRSIGAVRLSFDNYQQLRYGENPHQEGVYLGDLDEIFTKLNGKEISYNNLVDLDAAISLISEFEEPTFAIIKHTNACGIASRNSMFQAWTDALACDPISAFGGIIATNGHIDEAVAGEMNRLFFELLIAPSYSDEALALLKSKKNRIILQSKSVTYPAEQFKSALNGLLWQQKDYKTESVTDLKVVTLRQPSEQEIADLLWANKVVKHTKSNAIVLARHMQLVGSGTGQTSRVDATRQAIEKANAFGHEMHGAVMASDAFFPFPDSIGLAREAGITAIIQPGGSVKDNDCIDFCNAHNLAMVFTGYRHFKH